MRPFKRPNFVLHHDGHRLEAAGTVRSFQAATPIGGGGGASRRPALVDPQPVEAIDKPAHPLQRSPAAKTGREWLIAAEAEARDAPELPEAETSAPPASAPAGVGNRDAQIAERMVALVHELNRTMNEAVDHGLICEPVLSRVKSRYASTDGEGGYVLSLKLFRKLC